MEKPWKVIFAFVSVFIAGAVFGAFFSLRAGGQLQRTKAGEGRPRKVEAQNGAPAGQSRPLLGPVQPVQAAQIMRRYTERLDLSPEQRKKINPLIQRATEDIRRQQQNNFRENGIIVQRLQQDIARELRPEQRARLAEMEERQHELMQQQRAGNGEARGPARPAGRDQPRGPMPPPGDRSADGPVR
jgi:hypothetical protein